jgi:hypothetical protein
MNACLSLLMCVAAATPVQKGTSGGTDHQSAVEHGMWHRADPAHRLPGWSVCLRSAR